MGLIADIIQDRRNGNLENNKNTLITLAALPETLPVSKAYLINPLERMLEENGFILKERIGVGSTALVFRDDKDDVVRVAADKFEILDSDISIRPARNEEFLVTDAEKTRPEVKFTARLVPLGVTDSKKGESIGTEDMLTVAAILHHRGQLSCWVDVPIDTSTHTLEEAVKFSARDKLLYLPDPATGDVLRFSNGQPIPFIGDINSVTKDEEAISAFSGDEESEGSLARTYLKKAFHHKDGPDLTDAELDTLLEDRFKKLPPDWEESLKQQDTLLEAIRERHGDGKSWADTRIPPVADAVPAAQRPLSEPRRI